MVHDHKHNLNEIKENLDDINETKSIRYIAITEDDELQQHPLRKYQHLTHSGDNQQLQSATKYNMDFNDKQHDHKQRRDKTLSRRAKYVTMIGAVCCVTVLIGYVIYTRNGNNDNNLRILSRN